VIRLLVVGALLMFGLVVGGAAGWLAVAPAGAVVRDQASAAAEDIARVEAYLNGLTTMRAAFVQINPDGGTATGSLLYARPDKMRLDYDPPSDLLIVANGWQLVYYDRRLDQISHLRTSSTPLGFLLADEIRLDGAVTVTGVERRGGELLITLVQSEEPGQGAVLLAFAEQPIELRRWSVIDAQGLITHVVLERPEFGVPLADDLFRFRNPQFDPEARSRGDDGR
jgi:outer membrane lipoprotein-sorting protein